MADRKLIIEVSEVLLLVSSVPKSQNNKRKMMTEIEFCKKKKKQPHVTG